MNLDRFVFYSTRKLIESWLPLLVALAVVSWISGSITAALIVVGFYALIFVGIIQKHGPLSRPQLEVSNTEIAFGPRLATRIPLSRVKQARAGNGTFRRLWPGSSSVILDTESRLAAGQRYDDRLEISLFCADVPVTEIVSCINQRRASAQ